MAPRSSIAKKIINGFTGLVLCVFVIVHLMGNLLLLTGNPDDFNRYAHKLTSLGPVLFVFELGLLAFFVLHIWSALLVYFDKLKARPSRYEVLGSAGGASRKTLSSETMIYTGLVLLVFTVWHVITFRFGPGISAGYVTQLDGETVRDLYRLVVEFFSNVWNVIIYVIVMLFLGFHLRHGFWSALQSLGAYHPRWTPVWYTGGLVFAAVLAIGFIFIPVWVHFIGVSP